MYKYNSIDIHANYIQDLPQVFECDDFPLCMTYDIELQTATVIQRVFSTINDLPLTMR